MSITIEMLDGAQRRADWLSVPARTMGRDPAWVPPLHVIEKRRIDARTNPFFQAGEAAFFIAYQNREPVGRISAQINRRHLQRYQDGTGHFGFFDCIDDRAVAQALFDRARTWLATRGIQRMVGPFNLSVNEEIGLLVDGFDSPPAVLMPHGARWYGELAEASGLTKAMDVLAYRVHLDTIPPALQRFANIARSTQGIAVRTFDMRNYEREVALLIDIFNDAWEQNWSFVPFSDAEIKALVAETKPILRDGWGRFVMVDGREVGFLFVLPDFNRVFADFGGRLLPFNWWRLIRKIRRNDWETARIPLLGLRRGHQRSHLAPAMLALLVDGFFTESRNYRLQWVELSWVLESNRGMVRLAEMAAGPPAKRYRLYQSPT